MLYTEESVRANLRNRDGKRVFYLNKGDQLTAGARDLLSRERIPILPADQARQQRWNLWGGGFLEEKPEYMTHLNGETLVRKDHPRIRFRGAVDTLQSELLLCQAQSEPAVGTALGEVLQLARSLLRWDVLEEKGQVPALLGLTPRQLREQSHRPQDFFGQPHFMPEMTDPPAVLRLNRLRCAVRAAELAAVEAFCDRDGTVKQPEILEALNRMSSAIYILMLREKGKAERK